MSRKVFVKPQTSYFLRRDTTFHDGTKLRTETFTFERKIGKIGPVLKYSEFHPHSRHTFIKWFAINVWLNIYVLNDLALFIHNRLKFESFPPRFECDLLLSPSSSSALYFLFITRTNSPKRYNYALLRYVTVIFTLDILLGQLNYWMGDKNVYQNSKLSDNLFETLSVFSFLESPETCSS